MVRVVLLFNDHTRTRLFCPLAPNIKLFELIKMPYGWSPMVLFAAKVIALAFQVVHALKLG